MARLVHGALVVIVVGAAAVAAPAPAGGAPPPQEARFTTPGVVHQWTVPAAVHHVSIEACGATGGRSTFFSNPAAAGSGGIGGRARRTIDVTPGEMLRVRVGGTGGNSPGGGAAPGGANGGGTGQNGSGGGGGASDVRRGGDTLGHRLVIGGGGGGGGHAVPFVPGGERALPGGNGGGLVGGAGDAGASGGTQVGPGTNTQDPARNGTLGAGGNGSSAAGGGGGGGGGGLYGGAAGRNMAIEEIYLGAGAGGSGFGSELSAGACTTGAYVSLSYAPRSILPSGVLVAEGDGGYEVALLPVHLSEPADEAVTVRWSTGTLPAQPGYAQAGQDFVAASGVVTFSPGQTTAYVPLTFTDDDADEPDLLWGEWGVVTFSNPSGAVLDTTGFFGAGLFIIVDDD